MLLSILCSDQTLSVTRIRTHGCSNANFLESNVLDVQLFSNLNISLFWYLLLERMKNKNRLGGLLTNRSVKLTVDLKKLDLVLSVTSCVRRSFLSG